jgi:hypothetical protein
MPVSIFQYRRLMGLAFAAVLVTAAGLVSMSVKAYAQEVGADKNNKAGDDEVEDTIDTKFMKSFLSNLGLGPSSSAGIDYHERSPLVVPPTRDLPPPESKSAAMDPAWPKDPDMTQQKKTKRRIQKVNDQIESELRPLTPSEMTPVSKRKRTTDADGPSVPRSSDNSEGRADVLMPSQLGHEGFSFGNLFNRDGKEIKFEKEPDREALTDPPIGLRTPSPRYSYGTKGKLEKNTTVGEDRGVVDSNSQ